MPMTRPLSPATDGPRTRSDTLSPSCDFSTAMSWSRASSCACFSTTTSTSGRSQACTAIAPSKVSSVTLPGPVSLKVWVSEAVAPSVLTFTVQPAEPERRARLAPSMLDHEAGGWLPSRPLVVERRPGARPGSTPAPPRPTSARPGTPRRGRPDRRRRLPPAVRDRAGPGPAPGWWRTTGRPRRCPGRPGRPAGGRPRPWSGCCPPASRRRARRSARRRESAGRRARAVAPSGRPAPAVASVIASTPSTPLARTASRTIAGWMWKPSQITSLVTSSWASTAPARPGARCASGGMRLNRCVAWRAPAAIPASAWSSVAAEWPSDTRWPARDQPGDQIEGAVQFRRQRDQPHRGAMRVDHLDDGRAVEVPIVPRGLARPRREPQARRRLRPVVIGVQEVALEVRAEHPGRPGRPRGRRHVHGGQEPFERRRRAGHRRRAEGGDAVARQAPPPPWPPRRARSARRSPRRRGCARR